MDSNRNQGVNRNPPFHEDILVIVVSHRNRGKKKKNNKKKNLAGLETLACLVVLAAPLWKLSSIPTSYDAWAPVHTLVKDM